MPIQANKLLLLGSFQRVGYKLKTVKYSFFCLLTSLAFPNEVKFPTTINNQKKNSVQSIIFHFLLFFSSILAEIYFGLFLNFSRILFEIYFSAIISEKKIYQSKKKK
jgi:hypothetical protein